ncbi:MAG: right-handed parallel beta-helix repeat-containing protein [Deltaproteobacteria bacterium]|nr:right-handed parallel beta-helix repeat-containing protein [Deltaproteobacteria bacterium]
MGKVLKIFLFSALIPLIAGFWSLPGRSSEFRLAKWLVEAHAEEIGNLHVVITPQEAVDAGAQWNVDGGEWQDSGTTVPGLAVGEHTANYKDVIGWSPPVSEIVTLSKDEIKEITRSYVEQPVTIFCVSSAAELQTALTTAASNGADDIIRIVQGTYSGNFTYASTEGNGLSVEGGYTEECVSRQVNPDNTVLDGGGTDTVLALVSQMFADYSVEGVTLQNGNATTVDDGGGLYARTEGDVTLRDNTFSKNTASSLGGGAFILGDGTLTNNTFSENTASSSGGGAYIYGDGTLRNNVFSRNTASLSGGWPYGWGTVTNNTISAEPLPEGIGGGACILGDGTLTNNSFTGNTAEKGGGVYAGGTVTNNTFIGNTASSSGGGICAGGTVTNNIFTGNTAKWGGGASVSRSTSLTNNTFIGNTASSSGGGVYGGGTVSNNTFSGNTAHEHGGGAYFYEAGTLTNNIFTGNTADWAGGGAYLFKGGTLTNNTFAGNRASSAGGGAYLGSGDEDHPGSGSSLTNNLFTENVSGDNGAGIYAYGSSFSAINNTFTGNTSENQGGGIWVTLTDNDY